MSIGKVNALISVAGVNDTGLPLPKPGSVSTKYSILVMLDKAAEEAKTSL